MPRTSLSEILSANVIKSPYDVERFSLDWTKVKVGELVHVIDTGAFYLIKDVTELDNENGYLQVGSGGGGGGGVTSVGLSMPLGFSVGNSPVINTGIITVTTTLSGVIKGNGSGFVPAVPGTDFENPLTFSNGVTRAANSVTVDTTQNISRLSNLVTNGFIKSVGANGTLAIDTSVYLTASTGVSSLAGTSGEINASGSVGSVTLSLPSALTFTGKTVTGGTFNSGTFNGSLGTITPSTGAFTTLFSSGLIIANGSITSGSSITASGTVLGSNLSGTNTGDQTNISGNAGTATALQTARTINGVSFNGTANITIPFTADAGTLTGATLASNVVASSLTSLGTITSLAATAGTIAGTQFSTGLVSLTNGGLSSKLSASGGSANAFFTATAGVSFAGFGTDGFGITVGTVERISFSSSTLKLTFGTDSTLYRASSGVLVTDGIMSALGRFKVGTGADVGFGALSNSDGTIESVACYHASSMSFFGSVTNHNVGIMVNNATQLAISTSVLALFVPLQLNNVYVATPAVCTGTVLLKDSTGTSYRVLVST